MIDPSTGEVSLFFSSRLFITAMCFLGVLFMVTARLSMSVAIVCMVNHTATRGSDNHGNLHFYNGSSMYGHLSIDSPSEYENHYEIDGNLTALDDSKNKGYGGHSTSQRRRRSECGGASVANTSAAESRVKDGPFLWSKQQQGTILAAYFWGYVIFQVPAGWVVRKFGSIRMLGISMLIASATCLLTPLLAHHGYIIVAALRCCAGLVAGMVCPSVHNLLSNWLPPTERAKMGSFAYAGFPFGALVTFTGSGLLCEYGFADGWQSIFYVYGSLGLLFGFAWCIFVSETPARHKYISLAERKFIESKVGGTMKEGKPLDTPWKSILTSKAVWAVLFSSIANDFFGIIMWLFLPMYLSDILNFDISSNGVISSLPYTLSFFLSITFGFVSDAILERRWLSITALRKIFCCSGKTICIVCVVAVGFIGCEHAMWAVFCLVLSLGSMGLLTLGYYVNPMDIAPAYSGLIIALANTAGTLTGVASPYIVSGITGENPTRASWQIIFLMSAAVIATALVFYACFASGEIQPWALKEVDPQVSCSFDKAVSVHKVEGKQAFEFITVDEKEKEDSRREATSSDALLK